MGCYLCTTCGNLCVLCYYVADAVPISIQYSPWLSVMMQGNNIMLSMQYPPNEMPEQAYKTEAMHIREKKRIDKDSVHVECTT